MKAPSEKHLEDWIVNNPDKVNIKCDGYPMSIFNIQRIITTQYKIPSGILDILAVNDHGMILVFELKKGVIDTKAIVQSAKYIADLQSLWESVLYDIKVPADMSGMWDVGDHSSTYGFHLVLIGSDIKQDNTAFVCNSDHQSTLLYKFDGKDYTFSTTSTNVDYNKRKDANEDCVEIASVFKSKILELTSIDATNQYKQRWNGN